MKKTIKRTYFSKKLGMNITKEYTYDYKSKAKSRRSRVLVSKKGVVNKKNLEEYIESIKQNDEYSILDKQEIISDLKAYVQERKKEGRKLTISGFLGQRATDKIDRFFINAGYSAEEFAEEEGIDLEDIYNEKNWDADTFTVNGVSYIFNFTYTGSFWRKV